MSRQTLQGMAVVLAAATLLFDLNTELGVAGAVPYVGLVALALWSEHRWDTWAGMVAGTALTFVGWGLSPHGGITWKIATNRFLAVGAIWAMGLAVLHKQGLDIQLRASEQQRLAAEVKMRHQEALAQIGKMAAVVAHEVKNPLTGLNGALTILRRRMPEDSPDRQIVTQMQDRLMSLNASLEDLLVYARPEQPRRLNVPVDAVVNDTLALLRTDPALEAVHIEVETSEAMIYADPQLMQRALSNLILNGAQAAEGEGNISITTRTRGDLCEISVIDDGPGIPEEHRDQVLEAFFTTKARGTGLGLPTVKRTIEAHGGDLSLNFPEEGGTVVKLTVPLKR